MVYGLLEGNIYWLSVVLGSMLSHLLKPEECFYNTSISKIKKNLIVEKHLARKRASYSALLI